MVSDSNSVHERVTQLCEKVLKQHTSINPLKHRGSNVILKNLRTLSYEILLNKCRTSFTCDEDGEEEWDAVSKILAYSYKLHQQGLTIQAMKLYSTVDNMLDVGWSNNSTQETVLLFLANLAGEVPVNVQDNRTNNISDVYETVSTRVFKIPVDVHVKPYQEFHFKIFELPTSLDLQKNDMDILFNQEPGVGLTFLGKFGSTAPAKQKRRPLVEFLNFPDLTKPRDLAIPKNTSSQDQQFKDEGYASPSQDQSMTVSCVNSGVEPLGIEVWELALNITLPKLRTWETLGSIAPTKEKPFLTESDIECVQKVWKVKMGQMYMHMNPSLSGKVLLTHVDRKKLIQDLKFLLIGVPSQTFQYNQKETGFVMKSGVYVDGVTPGTLRSFCEDFLVSGACCLRLRKLVERNLMTGSHLQEGLIFQALCRSVRRYLQFYCGAVMMLPENPVLTQLCQQADGLHIQITSLGRLYKVHPNMSQDEDTILPEGVALLAYLYQEICKVTRKDLACVLYSALQSCCQVYFSFLQKWIFEGVCKDVYTEFFIQEQPDLMICRQREYWTKGYYMLEEAVPGFLRGLEVAVFQCGKAMNLLKLCNPQDAFCVVLQSGYPSLQCCLHSENLKKIEAECLSYENRALAMCGELLDIKKFFQCSQEEEQAFHIAVQAAQQETLQKLKLEHDMVISQALAKKRVQLAILKEQMELAETRKIEAKKRQLEEDEEHARKLAEMEKETARRTEIEKAEMVRYYSALSDVAEKRREHAEWRIKRMKLQEKRLELMCDDTESPVTIRSPNNNENIEDINSNLSDMNSRNNLRAVRTGSGSEPEPSNVDTENNTIVNRTFTSSNISDTQDNLETSKTHLKKDSSMLDAISPEMCVTQCQNNNVHQQVEETKPSPVKDEDQIDSFVPDKKSNNAKTEAQRNWRKIMNSEYNILTGERNYPMDVVIEPQTLPIIEEIESVEKSTSIETTKEGTETCATSVVCEVAESKVPVVKFSYTLQMSLGDAPLVNITDKVLKPVKDTASVSADDVGTADMSSVNIALQKSILIPLKIQTRLVNSALLKLFLEEENLLSHLQSLRNYFFLLDGEFGRNVTSTLFERVYQVARPVDLLNCVALNSILSKALTRPDPNVDRLSFNVKYIPPHFSFSSPLLLDCIVLQYKMTWPLNIIFTDAALHKYDDVFGFLLRLRRISWVLEEDFHRLKRGAEDRPGLLRSPQYHRVQLYRHEMTHFVRALQNYVTATVLQGSWVEFLQKLQNARTLDDLYRTHVAYIKMVLFRCLLNKQSSSIQKALLDTLRMILKFHGQLCSHTWELRSGTTHYQHPKFVTLVQIYNCFHNLAEFTFKFATKLANTGYQPHLLDLLQMLNMNGFYPEHF